jgi:hypothetical protein
VLGRGAAHFEHRVEPPRVAVQKCNGIEPADQKHGRFQNGVVRRGIEAALTCARPLEHFGLIRRGLDVGGARDGFTRIFGPKVSVCGRPQSGTLPKRGSIAGRKLSLTCFGAGIGDVRARVSRGSALGTAGGQFREHHRTGKTANHGKHGNAPKVRLNPKALESLMR